ncbi:type VII secretion target [Actinoplanes sp. RD1]|uniref:type VII secretion target n=1 Tax=Actinoplanes sp. RD1 TaxID=3064538 RepID=UPI002740D870|nr:type VII secretion target [Actinoplanes sp. RD1]
MTDRFEVRPADLLAHAGHIGTVAAGVEQAQAAGGAVRAGSGAYGQLCAMVPAMLNVLQGELIDGIADSAASLRDMGDQVRLAARQYLLTETTSSRSRRPWTGSPATPPRSRPTPRPGATSAPA